jgi:hypothetical protein
MSVPKTDNQMYNITLQIILVKRIMLQNDINTYNTKTMIKYYNTIQRSIRDSHKFSSFISCLMHVQFRFSRITPY